MSILNVVRFQDQRCKCENVESIVVRSDMNSKVL